MASMPDFPPWFEEPPTLPPFPVEHILPKNDKLVEEKAEGKIEPDEPILHAIPTPSGGDEIVPDHELRPPNYVSEPPPKPCLPQLPCLPCKPCCVPVWPEPE